MKAIWRGVVVAESDATRVVEGNHYFPPESVHRAYFRDSSTITICPWKGVASYRTLDIDGGTIEDAAWYYRDPKPAAAEIKGYMAFWRGVEVID